MSAEVEVLRRRVAELEAEQRLGAATSNIERSLDSILRSVPDIIYRLDAEGRIVFISEAIRKYGYEPEELVGHSLLDLIHPEDRDRARYRLNERRTGERRTLLLEVRFIARNQKPVPFELNTGESLGPPTLLVNAEGVYTSGKPRAETFLYTQGVARDISERKWAIDALERAQQQLEKRVEERTTELRGEIEQRRRAEEALQLAQFAVENAAEAILWFGEDGRLFYVNAEVCRMLGYHREELLGMSIAEVDVNLAEAQATWPLLWKHIQENTLVRTRESRIRARDGRVFPVEVTASYLEFEGRQYVCTFARDISERKSQEARRVVLQRLREEVWGMKRVQDIEAVIKVLRESLETLGVPVQDCSIHVVDESSGYPVVSSWRNKAGQTEWDRSVNEKAAENVLRMWRAGVPVYRRDLLVEDPFGEQAIITTHFGQGARSVLDVPYARGTVGINNAEPDAFSKDQIAVVGVLAEVLSEGFHRLGDLEDLEARRRDAEASALKLEKALRREEVMGRIRDQVIDMRHIEDLPSEDYWVGELRRLEVPADGISLQFPGEQKDHFVVYWLNENRYSGEISLDASPWVREAWESGQPIQVSRQRIEEVGWKKWQARCILEVPLSGGGSLGVNSRESERFAPEEVRTVQFFAGLVAEGLQRVRDFEALRLSEERYRSFLEELPVGVAHNTPDGRILYQNPYVRRLLGYSEEELAHMRTRDLYANPEDRDELVRALEARGEHTFEFAMRCKDGRIVWVRGRTQVVRDREGRVIRYQGFVEDITEQKRLREERDRLEEQLRQSQKMEAVGQLTAGIAHNFNNMLQGISGHVQLALLDAPEDIKPLLETAGASTMRAAEMVRQLMVFSRQGIQPRRQPMDLRPVVGETAEIARKTFDRRIAIHDEVRQPHVPVMGDAGQLQQVIMNLLLNARDALEGIDVRQPHIHIELSVLEVGEAAAEAERSCTYARLRVEDNGTGMDEVTQQRIFEPFFTTKPVDRGTGLGLSTVYGIVQQHGGWVECASEMGRGTTFSVYLPLLEEGVEDAIARPHRGGKGRTVMIVDDEEVVRRSVARMLERHGYRVFSARSGKEALELTAREKTIDLILLDLSMPVMRGDEVLSRLRRQGCASRVVIFTGYAAEVEEFPGAEGVVHKPFGLEELVQVVGQILEEQD